MSNIERRGRPPIDTTFRIRTKAWFEAVSQASGMNAAELEIHFAPSNKRKIYLEGNRPKLWEKYKAGRICPKSKSDWNGKESIVERVEKLFPGTAKWVETPFWQVLSYRPMEMSELKSIYLSLSKPVCELIVMERPPYNRMFWRRPTKTEDLYSNLLKIGGFDVAIAILALIKEAEITQNQLQHQLGLANWGLVLYQFIGDPVFSKFMGDINSIIEDKFSRISYADDGGTYEKLTKKEINSILNSVALKS
jgi:hypothetical protein